MAGIGCDKELECLAGGVESDKSLTNFKSESNKVVVKRVWEDTKCGVAPPLP